MNEEKNEWRKNQFGGFNDGCQTFNATKMWVFFSKHPQISFLINNSPKVIFQITLLQISTRIYVMFSNCSLIYDFGMISHYREDI